MPRIQRKLLAGLCALVLFTVAVVGGLAERGLAQRETDQIARFLEQEALLVQQLVGNLPFEGVAAPRLDAVADAAGEAIGARVTLIASDGAVVGDSDVPAEALSRVVNHADRPEVSEALAGRVGRDARRSATVGRRLFYLAIPAGQGRGVIRLAVDLSDVDASIASLRRELMLTGLVGLAAAVALSVALASVTLRPIRELRRATASIARGDLDVRLPLRASDEMGEIWSAVNHMAEQLRLRLDEANAEKERLRAVLNGMFEGVLVVDAKGDVALANARLREFYDAWGDVEGRSALWALRDEELAGLLERAQSTDNAVSATIQIDRGRPRTLEVQAVRFPAGSTPRLGTVAVLHDVSDLAHADKVRRDFVANASHELRTPLAAVRGFAETLLSSEKLSEDERRNYLEIIDRQARRLGALVDDLLALSRIENEGIPLALARVNVAGVARSLVADVEPRVRTHGISMHCETPEMAVAWAERQSVEQILSNLLDNATKYTEPGGRVAVKVSQDPRSIHVEVSDTGIGIPEEDLDRIFERFYRVDKARSRELGGTGLGLSIVKHLVQRLGGDVQVESEVGRGTRFGVSLPRPV